MLVCLYVASGLLPCRRRGQGVVRRAGLGLATQPEGDADGGGRLSLPATIQPSDYGQRMRGTLKSVLVGGNFARGNGCDGGVGA